MWKQWKLIIRVLVVIAAITCVLALILYGSSKVARSNNNQERADKLQTGMIICGATSIFCLGLLGGRYLPPRSAATEKE